nr:immunoglobulin light chain junction region [Macaca mulatta]MPO05639.1 immunoglobulin light chain junction region [Macaca mulatta]MPO08014.1 immunoglobulin light chain junction region [Macaca mulatta]
CAAWDDSLGGYIF